VDIPVLWWVVAGLALALLLAVLYSVRITRSYFGLRRLRRGDAVRRGFTTEQWLPLTESYPWDPRNFRFLGAPIDGVQFEDDRVVLVEFKSGRSRLSDRQLRIRELVQSGRVEFREVRVDPGRADSMRVR
jgi:predicted Holliday junction resolvase-like endonuclease